MLVSDRSDCERNVSRSRLRCECILSNVIHTTKFNVGAHRLLPSTVLADGLVLDVLVGICLHALLGCPPLNLELQLRHLTSLLYLVNHGHLALQRDGHVDRELQLLNLHGLLDRAHGRLDLHHDKHVDNTHQ